MHAINTIVDTMLDITDRAEYMFWSALYMVLCHCQDIIAEIVTMRFPVVDEQGNNIVQLTRK